VHELSKQNLIFSFFLFIIYFLFTQVKYIIFSFAGKNIFLHIIININAKVIYRIDINLRKLNDNFIN